MTQKLTQALLDEWFPQGCAMEWIRDTTDRSARVVLRPDGLVGVTWDDENVGRVVCFIEPSFTRTSEDGLFDGWLHYTVDEGDPQRTPRKTAIRALTRDNAKSLKLSPEEAMQRVLEY